MPPWWQLAHAITRARPAARPRPPHGAAPQPTDSNRSGPTARVWNMLPLCSRSRLTNVGLNRGPRHGQSLPFFGKQKDAFWSRPTAHCLSATVLLAYQPLPVTARMGDLSLRAWRRVPVAFPTENQKSRIIMELNSSRIRCVNLTHI